MSQVSWCAKNFQHLDSLRHHQCDKRQTLHDSTTYGALLVHTTFNDLAHISHVTEQERTVLTENFVLIQLS